MLAVNRRVANAASSTLDVGELNYTALAMETEGYAPADLLDLASRAVHQAVISCSAEKRKVRSHSHQVDVVR
jgi:hypothetical protein